MTLHGALLWTHVAFGALWIGAALCFVLAAAVLDRESGERDEFAVRAAPTINRLGMAAAVIVILTGLANLWTLGISPGFRIQPDFLRLLEGKLVLYSIMVIALWASLRAATKLIAARRDGLARELPVQTGRLARFNLVMAVCGAVALALGLWLAGT
jgi:hypothetical protein